MIGKFSSGVERQERQDSGGLFRHRGGAEERGEPVNGVIAHGLTHEMRSGGAGG